MSAVAKILVVDDEKEVRNFFSYLLADARYQVTVAGDGEQAKRAIAESAYDLALVDLKLPDTDGISLLKEIKSLHSSCEVIIMTGYSTVKSAVLAIQLGAYDYLDKPFDDITELEKMINSAISLNSKDNGERELYYDHCRELGITVGQDRSFRTVLTLAAKIAPKDLSVLITGETGTGKELMARFVHHCSRRKEGPFFAINCGAMVETLLESELFGHEKGSFTGATEKRKGFFQLADKGSLFLDEIGESSKNVQVKLLRALEAGEFLPVGGTKKISSDVRIIAATNVDLERAVSEESFRADLFYRLDVVRIHIPPLRERREDIPILAEELLQKKAANSNIQASSFARKTIELLKEYKWPGNIRELANVVSQAAALAEGGEIQPFHLPQKIRNPNPINYDGCSKSSSDKLLCNISDEDLFKLTEEELREVERKLKSLLKKISGEQVYEQYSDSSTLSQLTLAEMEKKMIIETLNRNGGNVSVTAEMLGIGRNTLYRKINKYEL